VTGKEHKEDAEGDDPWDFFIKPWHIERGKKNTLFKDA
jgi:hypothetical protein